MSATDRSETPILKFGIGGLGRGGAFTVPVFARHPRVEVAAAADLDENKLEVFAKDFGAKTYRSIEKLCRSDDIDAIYVATPTELHARHAIEAAEHRKHVIVEKPMATTLEDADAMIEAAERNGVKLIVGHSHSFDTPILGMRRIVESGELGRVRMINNWYFNDWLYRPRTREELDTGLGGGVTFRQGSHQFDIIRLIGGGLVRSVRAMTGVWDESRPTEGSHAVFLEFEDGMSATAVYNGYDHFHTTELTFGIGEDGGRVASDYAVARKALSQARSPEEELKLKESVGYGGARAREHPGYGPHQLFFGLTVVSCEKGDIRQSPDGLLIYGEEERREIPLPSDETGGRGAMINELYEAVVHDRQAIHDGRWAKANLEVCLAVLESARERKEVFLSHQTPITG